MNYVKSQPGWVLVAEYSDDASGATTDRPELQRALGAAKSGRYDILLVYRVDRFSRRLCDLLTLLRQLDEASVAFCSATEPFDTSTPIGRMLIQLLGVFAEFERETIIDRVINGMRAKAAKGKWPGGTRPYGYHVDRDTHRLIPHPDEAPVLREIFTLYTHHRLGTRALADELNQRGLRNRSGKPFSGYTVARILDNPAYTGDIVYGDVHVEAAHEPLIDQATFAEARAIATLRADDHHHRAVSPGGYWLTGLITCPDCGHKYIGTAATGRNRQYRYYTCFSRSRYGKAGCQGTRLNADATDDAVLHALASFYASADHLMGQIIEAAQHQFHAQHDDRHAELDTITAQISKTEAAIERYHLAFENGTMDDTTAGPRIRDLRTKVTQLRGRRDDLEDELAAVPTPPRPGTIKQLQTHLIHIITEGSPTERKRAIEALIAEVRITRQGEVIPVFKIPTCDSADTMTRVNDAGAAETTTPTTGSRNGKGGGPPGTRTPNPQIKSPKPAVLIGAV
ncbi:MAG: recombinase family protein [Dactylosporangium sp.]|nr:recombinase family protein [Dactylosporangium sp.]